MRNLSSPFVAKRYWYIFSVLFLNQHLYLLTHLHSFLKISLPKDSEAILFSLHLQLQG